jgi:hypothetical protein
MTIGNLIIVDYQIQTTIRLVRLLRYRIRIAIIAVVAGTILSKPAGHHPDSPPNYHTSAIQAFGLPGLIRLLSFRFRAA